MATYKECLHVDVCEEYVRRAGIGNFVCIDYDADIKCPYFCSFERVKAALEFREQESGTCNCGRYSKESENPKQGD